MRKLFYFNKKLFPFVPDSLNGNIFHRSYLGKRPESKTIKVSQKPFIIIVAKGIVIKTLNFGSWW